MSFWLGTAISKNRAHREWRGTPRTPRSMQERIAIRQRLKNRRLRRMLARITSSRRTS